MASKLLREKTCFGRCICCLAYGYMKNMWNKYTWQGENEVYGKMLNQCFALTWEQQDLGENDQICEPCVLRLRDAIAFKQLVISSQNELMQEMENDAAEANFQNKIEEEYESILKGEITNLTSDHNMSVNSEDEVESVVEQGEVYAEPLVVALEEPVFEEVEYLEEKVSDVPSVTSKSLPDSEPPSSESDDIAPRKQKWPKRLTRKDRYKRFFQYTEDDIRRAMDAIKNNMMTKLEASKYYSVPNKTLALRLKLEGKGGTDPYKEKIYSLIQEIKSILTYTNATPFKTKVIKYYCAYCSEGEFRDAADLRNHTRKEHMDDRTKRVDIIMRPHRQNEILKLDIDNLLCVACCTPLYTWKGMLDHLKDEHDVHFKYTHKHVIPFRLKADYECVLCNQTFMNYLQLDGHMNCHYDNYVCGDCGDTFLTITRLKCHLKTHTAGSFPCHYCCSIFSMEIYRRKHENLIHKKTNSIKCAHCPQKFNSEKDRKYHCLSEHGDLMKEYTCEVCGMTTKWRQSFHDHMKSHLDKKHECDECWKKFHSKADLMAHVKRHRNGNKHTCSLCKKVCTTRAALMSHLKVHKNSVINSSSWQINAKDSVTDEIVLSSWNNAKGSVADKKGAVAVLLADLKHR